MVAAFCLSLVEFCFSVRWIFNYISIFFSNLQIRGYLLNNTI